MKQWRSNIGWYLPVVVLVVALSGCRPVSQEFTEPIRIEVSGYSTNPISIDWTIHGLSGSVSSLMLNHTVDDPYIIERIVTLDSYDSVGFSISDTTAPAGAVISGAAATIVTPGTNKTIQLDQSLSVTGGMIVSEGDYLQVSGAPTLLFRLSADPDPANDTQVRIYDMNVTTPDNFPDPFPASWTWDLYNSNAHSISATVKRGDTTLETKTAAALIGIVSLELQSESW